MTLALLFRFKPNFDCIIAFLTRYLFIQIYSAGTDKMNERMNSYATINNHRSSQIVSLLALIILYVLSATKTKLGILFDYHCFLQAVG